jgi:hypothetical protein
VTSSCRSGSRTTSMIASIWPPRAAASRITVDLSLDLVGRPPAPRVDARWRMFMIALAVAIVPSRARPPRPRRDAVDLRLVEIAQGDRRQRHADRERHQHDVEIRYRRLRTRSGTRARDDPGVRKERVVRAIRPRPPRRPGSSSSRRATARRAR